MLDRLTPTIADRPSSWNRALALRSQLSATAEEALRYGVRLPASFGTSSGDWRIASPWDKRNRGWMWTSPSQWDEWENTNLRRYLRRGPLVMQELSDILDSAVPLDRFAEIASETEGLPQQVRQDLVIAAWVRAVLLEDRDRANALALEVAKVAPETQADMERFRASAPAERKLAAVTTMLKFPGMSARVYPGVARHSPLNEIHLSGFNWWWWTRDGDVAPDPPQAGPVDWLKPDERNRAEGEWARIIALGSGSEWLYQTVLDRCDRADAPALCAEALYRASLSVAYINYWHGIQYIDYDVKTKMDNEGPQILQRRFPSTRWAQRIGPDRNPKKPIWQDDIYDYRLAAPYPTDATPPGPRGFGYIRARPLP